MRILIVDDDKNIRHTLSWLLTDEGHEVVTCSDGGEAVDTTRRQVFDVIFLDLMMPVMGGLEALERIRENQPEAKVFMISGQGDLQSAVRATRLGAYDFLEKPLNPDKVLLELKKITEQQKANEKIRELSQLVDADYRMVGESEAIRQLREVISQAAPSDGRILIYGENGTGKELVAREIYQHSNRRDKPFVQLNCAAIPDELLESELFGYERGAFTGAYRKKAGLIEQAEGGTLLLDEIGDMSLSTQAKLLRVLQENQFYRVGGEKPIRFDVRIISATNKILVEEISAGRFREDLYFRLNVIPITVPPLRERMEDIPLLVRHFMESYSRRNGKKMKEITDGALDRLCSYHWPGNIRELKNIMERLAIMTRAPRITAQDVETVLGGFSGVTKSAVVNDKVNSLGLKDKMTAYEKSILHNYFEKYRGNVSHMAAALKTDRANLHKKLKKYGIK